MPEVSPANPAAAAVALTVVTRVPVAGTRAVGTAAHLVIGDRASTTVIDVGRGLRTALDGDVRVAQPCDAPCLGIVWRQDALHAIDVADGGERWTNRAIAPGSAVQLVSVLTVASSLVIELDWTPPGGGVAQRQWWVLDRASGALRFRFDRADDRWLCPWPRVPASAQAIVYRTRGGAVGLLDATSGRVHWQVDQPGAPPDLVLADDRGAVVAGNFGPVVGLDLTGGGRRFARELLGRRVAAIALDGDRVWVLTGSGESRERGTDQAELAWLDRATGALHTVAPWPSLSGGAPVVRAGADNAGLWPADRILFVMAGDGILRALDRDDGRARWSWGVGADAHVVLTGKPGAARPAIVAEGEVWIFGAGHPPPLTEAEVHGRVTIDGKPASRVTVVVGDSAVQTDDAGNYQLRIRGRGRVTIHAGRACGDGADAFDGTTQVVLTAASPVRADVTATAVGCE